MIWTIRLTLADVCEADALAAIDDEGRWPRDVEGGEPETMIDAVALDHGSVRVDEDRKPQTAGTLKIGDLLGALADDHHDLGAEGPIRCQMGLQLLQLLAAVRSPGAADEHDDRSPGTDHISQPDFFSVAGPQCERWCRIARSKG
jgi:hypothetical protein